MPGITLAEETEPRWGSVINPNGVLHRWNPFVVHFRGSRPSLEAYFDKAGRVSYRLRCPCVSVVYCSPVYLFPESRQQWKTP